MHIQAWLRQTTDTLRSAGVESAPLDATLLAEEVLGKPREWITAHPDYVLSAKDVEMLNKNVVRRREREPLAYILGSKEFYGYKFIVNEAVLIPRPESESMIELLKNAVASTQIKTIIDVGTGSGCLAITAKLVFPSLNVVASDVSTSALAVAKANAQNLGATVEFIESNLLPTINSEQPIVVLANLPYVPTGLITSKEITHEPSSALFSGSDGLDHYHQFWIQIKELENKPILIMTESLKNQHAEMIQLAETAGYKLTETDILAQQFIRM